MEQTEFMNKWYRLDNAAKIFPSVTNVRTSSVFRISAIMTHEVDPIALQKAVEHIYRRFPLFFVRLRNGLFWNYFDPNVETFSVEEETESPCDIINLKKRNGYLIKVLYYHKRISIEIFHSLTDGNGAVEFCKSLLYYYLLIKGEITQSPVTDVILAETSVPPYEIEDSYSRYHSGPLDTDPNRITHMQSKSFRIVGSDYDRFGTNVVSGIISARQLNETAKSKNATITTFLTAVLIYSISQCRAIYDTKDVPIIVAVPVNLRKIFPSKTLRNFFSVANIGYGLTKQASFDEMIEICSKELKEKTTKEILRRDIANKVRLERNVAARFVPLFVKNMLVSIGFDLLGEKTKTLSFSNLGRVRIPECMSPSIQLLEFNLYSTPKSPINCSAVTYGDNLVISFSRTIVDADILQYFFSFLSEYIGTEIKIYSNDWGNER